MGLLFGYLSNDFSLVPSAFSQASSGLSATSATSGASATTEEVPSLDWGLSYVQNSQVLLRKNLDQPSADFNFAPLVDDLRSDCIVGVASKHASARSGMDIPPYRFREWLMAHDGDTLDVTSYRRRLIEELPDYVASNIEGDHPSEVLLHFFMERVRRATGQAGDALAPQIAAKALAEAVVEVKRMAHESGAESPPILNVLLTNGSVMVVSCSGHPVCYSMMEGIYDDPVRRDKPLFAGHRPKQIDHPTFRAAFFTNGVVDESDIWQPMGDDSVAYVDPQHNVVVQSLDAIRSTEG